MRKQSGIHWPTVAQVFAGGALTGAGVGGAVSYIRYLNDLNRRAAQQTDTSGDDDVLYVNLPAKRLQPGLKQAASDGNNAPTFAVAGLGGLAGTYLAYNLVRGLAAKQRRKRLQSELDQAQQVYLGGLNQQADLAKQASQFSVLSKGVGTAYMAALIAALGAGLVTNRILQKQFPSVKPPTRDKPRKIVLRSAGAPGTTPATEDVVTPSEVTPDAVEGVLRTHLGNKVASHESGFADLVAAAADGRCRELKQTLQDGGIDAMFAITKGASFRKRSSVDTNLAITWLATDPMMSAALQPVLAAEFYEQAPGICKLAAHVDPEFHNDLVGFSEAVTSGVRGKIYAPIVSRMEKSAGALAFMAGSLTDNALISHSLEKILEERSEKRMSEPGVSADAPVDPLKKDPQYEIDDETAKTFMAAHGKDIQNALAKV